MKSCGTSWVALAVPAFLLLSACKPPGTPAGQTTGPAPQASSKEKSSKEKRMNAAIYFEIPASDLNRAVRFYEAVFEVALERRIIDGYEMALFPWQEQAPGITGALVKGDVYVPAKAGPILYFASENIDGTLQRAVAAGGKVLYPKKAVDAGIEVAEFEDSEGNRIALQTRRGPAG